MTRCMTMFGPLVAAAALASAAAAQPVEQMARVHGVITALTAGEASVSVKDAPPARVMVSADTQLMTSQPIAVSAIEAGRYVGTANVDRPDGSGVSAEVHVFAGPAGQGINTPWGGGQMMTNGAVASVADTPEGRRLKIDYGPGSKTVIVPATTPVVLLTPTKDRALVKVGATVLVAGPRQADGSIRAAYMTIDVPGAAH